MTIKKVPKKTRAVPVPKKTRLSQKKKQELDAKDKNNCIVSIGGNTLYVLDKQQLEKFSDTLIVNELKSPLSMTWHPDRDTFIKGVLSGFNLLQNGTFGHRNKKSLVGWDIDADVYKASSGDVDLSEEWHLENEHTAFLMAAEGVDRPSFKAKNKIPTIGDGSIEYYFSGYFATHRAGGIITLDYFDKDNEKLGDHVINIPFDAAWAGGRSLAYYGHIESFFTPTIGTHYMRLKVGLGKQEDFKQPDAYLFFTKFSLGQYDDDGYNQFVPCSEGVNNAIKNLAKDEWSILGTATLPNIGDIDLLSVEYFNNTYKVDLKSELETIYLLSLGQGELFNKMSHMLQSKYYLEAKQLIENKGQLKKNKWRRWAKEIRQSSYPHPNVTAGIDVASATQKGTGAVIMGWVVQYPGSIIWIEDAKGEPYFFDNAYWEIRRDICDSFVEDMAVAKPETGFILHLEGLKPSQQLFIKALSPEGIHLIANFEVTQVSSSEPAKLAEWLFSINSCVPDRSERITKVDLPFIQHVLLDRRACIEKMAVKVNDFAMDSLESKLISIIIPLYGRIDFFESQMLEFAQDDFIKKNVELIYVIDDPTIVETFNFLSDNVFNIYKIPFKVVWGGMNRGFSGANNLGASCAQGEHLIFMNSDVFPIKPGWVEVLIANLKENPEIGIIGPRLLLADGSIQHASMEFKQRKDLGIWANYHPNMGLDPSLDPYKELTHVPAVTGACLAISREDFDSVDGWDTGYLIGDFEDSDLCLKIHKKDKKCAYLPSVELTHLERQSFGLIGTGDFREKVIVFNATRHQNRWRDLIEKLSSKNHLHGVTDEA